MPRSGFNWSFEIPTWERIYELHLNLADRVRRAHYEADIIVGVARGGWPVARIMSDLLENSELANVKAEFYVGVAETKGEPMITQSMSMPVKNKKVLIVDDVADSGKTLALVRKHLESLGAAEIKIATVYCKPWSIVKPDWCERKTEHWIVFPWERKETVRQVLEKSRKQGTSLEKAKEILVQHGLERRLVERFMQEIAEEKQ